MPRELPNVELREIVDARVVQCPELRGRFESLAFHSARRKYLAVQDGVEVGMFSVDIWDAPDPEILALNEIWVRSDLRCRCIGTLLLTLLEDIARNCNRFRIVLTTGPLNDDSCPRRLRKWYESNGYGPSKLGELEKIIDAPAQLA